MGAVVDPNKDEGVQTRLRHRTSIRVGLLPSEARFNVENPRDLLEILESLMN
jgi:hypothetical protein